MEFSDSKPDTTVDLHPELEPTKSEDVGAEQTETVSNSNDLDQAIDEYAEYMDDYIKYMKKAKAGDQTAMLDAVELMSKAEPVHKKLADVKGELTAKQLAKFMKVQNKMIEAAR